MQARSSLDARSLDARTLDTRSARPFVDQISTELGARGSKLVGNSLGQSRDHRTPSILYTRIQQIWFAKFPEQMNRQCQMESRREQEWQLYFMVGQRGSTENAKYRYLEREQDVAASPNSKKKNWLAT